MAELYLVTGPGGLQYVGVTTRTAGERWKGHVRRAGKRETRFACAIAKHGPEVFKVETLVRGTWEEVLTLEDEYITRLGTLAPRGYNTKRGGLSGIPTQEVKDKMSKRAKEQWQDPEHRAARVACLETPERLQQLSDKLKELWHDPEVRPKLMENILRRNADPEFRAGRAAHMREINKDPEVLRRSLASRKRRWAADPELRERVSKQTAALWAPGTPLRERHSEVMRAAWARRKARAANMNCPAPVDGANSAAGE
jgi:hypothetical protein